MIVDMNEESPAAVARGYLRALEKRAPIGAIAAFLHQDAVIEVLPNLLDRQGSRRTLAEGRADMERGRALLHSERYEVMSTIEDESRAVLEVTWSAVLAVPLGTRPAGSTMSARCSMHFEVREGRIALQRNYDCFESR